MRKASNLGENKNI